MKFIHLVTLLALIMPAVAENEYTHIRFVIDSSALVKDEESGELKFDPARVCESLEAETPDFHPFRFRSNGCEKGGLGGNGAPILRSCRGGNGAPILKMQGDGACEKCQQLENGGTCFEGIDGKYHVAIAKSWGDDVRDAEEVKLIVCGGCTGDDTLEGEIHTSCSRVLI